MAKEKQVLLFIVEGSTDETAFGLLFERLFANSAVVFDIVGGDLTTDVPLKGDPREKVRGRVLAQIERKDYGWKDIKRIVQITDLDGAFVPDEAVKGSSDGHLRYTEDLILAPCPNDIIERNHVKKNALRKLASIGCLTYRKHAVPFSVYYLSRNMEHALHGLIEDVDVEEKERLARAFQRRYKDDLKGFLRLLGGREIAVPGTYEETWKHAEVGENSLKRGSNLHLALGIEPIDSLPA